jgi:hypothetical protein
MGGGANNVGSGLGIFGSRGPVDKKTANIGFRSLVRA